MSFALFDHRWLSDQRRIELYNVFGIPIKPPRIFSNRVGRTHHTAAVDVSATVPVACDQCLSDSAAPEAGAGEVAAEPSALASTLTSSSGKASG